MKKVLTALLATGFLAGYAGAGYACAYHSAHLEKKLTTAQSEMPAEADDSAMSTHDPDAVRVDDERKAE